MREMVGGCCVCSDDRGWSENPLVYCDGQSCTVAVHQACYGIVSVPTGPWYCRKCESQERAAKVKCELCPSRYGALKRTDNSGWAHVVCALYIPEVRFGNVTTMEPIQLQLIPPERFSKVCYICEEKGKPANASVGACMQCNRAGCKQQFHVTCAQSLGLLCEEAGNYLDNVKYCGYCQHHYSKLKKGGNVKTIPPYKPVSAENHLSDSNSEKEADPPKGTSQPSRKNKSSAVKSSGTAPKGSKTSPPNSKSSSNAKTVKVNARPRDDEPDKTDPTDSEKSPELKESKGSKKRKANSRTPTPITVPNESAEPETPVAFENKEAADNLDKIKKARVDLTQSIAANQPIVALTSLPSIKSSPSSASPTNAASTESALPTQSIIQPTHPAVNSLVVSVPLSNTSLSPHHGLGGNQPSVLVPNVGLLADKNTSNPASEQDLQSNLDSLKIEDEGASSSSMLTMNLEGVGLRIAYEKQESTMNNTEVDMELEEMPAEAPVKRTRSQSNDKSDAPKASSRGKKRSSGGRRSGARAGAPSPHLPGAFASVTQSQIKSSPPSSPSSESQGPVQSAKGRPKGRKSAPATAKDVKDTKIFTNGVIAPHMLGNQLNPNSNMAHKMNEHLSSELEAHSIFNPNENANLVGPQLQHKVIASARASNPASSSGSSSGGISSMLGGAAGGTVPQTLDQLLERQWEQGSQFLMEQAQHFDIASLLSCLHQLRAENLRLEEHVSSLLQRRDHLLAVNARLAIPLTGQPVTPQSTHAHGVNNIHPAVVVNHGEVPRTEAPRSRHSTGSANYPAQPQGSNAVVPVENGLPSDSGQPFASQGHHSPPGRQSHAGNVRNPSPAASHRQSADGRSGARLHQYPVYQGAGSAAQPQVAVRREGENPGSKPS